jgi:hypothetical protein
MIQIAAAVLLLLGSGLIFKALVEVDTPSARPRPLARRDSPSRSTDDEPAVPLRRAA